MRRAGKIRQTGFVKGVEYLLNPVLTDPLGVKFNYSRAEARQIGSWQKHTFRTFDVTYKEGGLQCIYDF